jgi:hypothetical protein
MQNVFSTLLGPILVLWIGALVFYVLDRFLEPQDAGVAETFVLVLATGVLILGRARVGTPFYFGRALTAAGWVGGPPFLRMERTAWVLALIVLGTALAASLSSLGQEVHGRSGRTATLGAMLLLLSAGDWATLALAWTLMGLSLLYTVDHGNGSAGERDKETARRRRLAFASMGGAVLLGAAVTLWQLSGDTIEVKAAPPWPVAGLAMGAALLRLLPWPLPSWYYTAWNDVSLSEASSSAGAGSREGPGTPLAYVVPFVSSTLSGVYLWARLGQRDPTAAEGRWLIALSVWAGLALLLSALRAWSAQEPRRLVEQAAPYGAALCLLAAGFALPTSWQLLIGASAVLNVCALYLGWTHCQYLDIADPRSYWRVAPMGLALLSLAGQPLTLGFPARVAIYSRAFDQGRWLVLLLMLLGEAGMLGALLRVLFDVERVVESELELGRDARRSLPLGWGAFGARSIDVRAWLQNLAYGGGAMLALGGIILGIAPGLLGAQGLFYWFGVPRLHVWAALLLPAIGGVALYRSQEDLIAWLDEWWPLLRHLFDLRWAGRALERGARLVGRVVWGGSQVIEGAGYMAWVVLFCLVAFLFLRSG